MECTTNGVSSNMSPPLIGPAQVPANRSTLTPLRASVPASQCSATGVESPTVGDPRSTKVNPRLTWSEVMLVVGRAIWVFSLPGTTINRTVCNFECAGVAQANVSGVRPRLAPLISLQRRRHRRLVGALPNRNEVDRLAVRVQRDGVRRPAIVLQACRVEIQRGAVIDAGAGGRHG